MVYIVPTLMGISGVLVLIGSLVESSGRPRQGTHILEIVKAKPLTTSGALLAILVGIYDGVEAGRSQGIMQTLVEETRAYVTGGNSFAYIGYIQKKDAPERVSQYLLHGGGNIPAYDIRIEYQDNGRCNDFAKWTYGEVMSTGTNNPKLHSIPSIMPMNFEVLQGNLEPNCEDAHYVALVKTRNRSFIQQSLLRKINGNWVGATRLLNLLSGEIQHEYTPQGFGILTWPDISTLRNGLLAVTIARKEGADIASDMKNVNRANE